VFDIAKASLVDLALEFEVETLWDKHVFGAGVARVGHVQFTVQTVGHIGVAPTRVQGHLEGHGAWADGAGTMVRAG